VPAAVTVADVDPIAQDFRKFLWAMWKFLRLPDPTRIQYDIARYLQSGPRRRMVQAFRGVGKSWITAAFVLWRLYKNPNERILVVSASKDRADAFSTFLKRCIAEWDLLAHLQPEPGMRDSNVAFDVGGSDPHQAPSVRSVGITGQLTGGRASIIVPDDIETPKNSLTQTMRDRLAELVKEFDAVLTPDGETVYLGTPQTEMSLYNALPERGYDVRIWPSRYPKNVDAFKGRLAPIILKDLASNMALAMECAGRGAPTDPKRFHDTDLLEREASYGRSGFALQFQLDTSLSDANRYPLKLADLMVMGFTPELLPAKVAWGSGPEQIRNDLPVVALAGDRWHRPMFVTSQDMLEPMGCVMTIDPSGRGGDKTGYAVVAMLNGFLWVLECGGLEGGYSDEVLQTLANIAKRNKVKWIVIEPNFGDGMFDKLFAPFLVRTYPCTIDPDPPRSSIQKEKRIIDTLEPVMNQHRLIFNETVVRKDFEVDEPKHQLCYQLTRITREKGALANEDGLDALAMAVGYWVEVMDKDVNKIEDERRQAMLDMELEKFMGSLDPTSTPDQSRVLNWMSDLR
jgi:hypothetical protein